MNGPDSKESGLFLCLIFQEKNKVKNLFFVNCIEPEKLLP